jgi:ferrous iron transport protein A
LADLARGGSGVIVAVRASNEHLSPELLRRLAELGFFPGEPVRVLATGPFGREPIAVRIGTSTFALRKVEAECVQVAVATPQA